MNNPIAILISWPREFDMLSPLIHELGENVVFLVDDLEYSEKERIGNSENIIELLQEQGSNYLLLSKSLGKKYFKIVISTGLSFIEKITIKSFSKYLYAISIGGLLEFAGIAALLERYTGKRYSAGGYKAVSFERKQFERTLGEFTVRYPKGLDLSRKYYPEKRWAGVFDLHLCHGEIDKQLVEIKLGGASCLKIGYPKYQAAFNENESRDRIFDEFAITDITKPLLLWMPTHLKNPDETAMNISAWIPRLRNIQNDFTILIRVHPKTVVTRPDVTKQLGSAGFLVDINRNRNLNELYSAAHLVLADYGASVISAIYMEKILLLLESDPIPASIARILSSGYLDLECRNSLPVITDEKQVTRYFKDYSANNKPNTLAIKNEIFGNENEIEPITNIAAMLLEKGQVQTI